MSRSGLTRLLLVVLLLAVGSVACIAGPGRPVADLLQELVDRPAVLDEAENRLIAECMNRAGMFYPPIPPQLDGRPMIGLIKGSAPLLLDDARDHGYPDTLMNGGRNQGRGPVEAHTETLSADARESFHRLLTGDHGNDVRVTLPDDFEVAASSAGCRGSARQRLYGSVRNFLTVFYLPELAQRRASSADGDPDVRAAYGSYSQCMTANGYRIATPADALALAKTYYPAGRRESAGNDEKMLAATDARCRISARLHERRAEAADRIVRSWLADNETAVSHAHSMLEGALAEASAVVGSSGDRSADGHS